MKLKDISIFFMPKSQCCVKLEATESTCQRSPKSKKITMAHEYFKIMYGAAPTSIHATTITIGEKWIGKLSSEVQYNLFKRHIQKHIAPYTADDAKYCYHFELQQNGQLHAHGIEFGTYHNRFIESFIDFGKRNKHPDAFTHVIDIDKYLEYIDKENIFPPITNVKKGDLCRNIGRGKT